MNKRFFAMTVGVGGIAVLAVCISLARGTSSSARPMGASLAISDLCQDLGHNSIRQERCVSFSISNFGTRRLVLNELDLECGCGDRVLRTILVAPGKKVSVKVPCDMRFPNGSGEYVASFTTNDAVHPRFNVNLRPFVAMEKPVRVDPEERKQASILIRH